MIQPAMMLLTLEGKQLYSTIFPYIFKKNKQKKYFEIAYGEKGYSIKSIAPYTVKIMNQENDQKDNLENFDRILIIKNKKGESEGEKKDLKEDNVINTVTFVDMKIFND